MPGANRPSGRYFCCELCRLDGMRVHNRVARMDHYQLMRDLDHLVEVDGLSIAAVGLARPEPRESSEAEE